MSIRKPLFGFGVFAVVSVLLTAIIWTTLQRNVEGDTNTYTATFSDVLGLKVGDDVRVAGVRVGRVESIGLDADNNARVGLAVRTDQRVLVTSKALVRYQNLIGQRYVEITRGPDSGAPLLEPGAEIPLSRTEPSFDVSQLLGGLQPLFDVLQPNQINSLSQTFIQALQGDKVSLSGFLAQAAALATTFGDRDALLTDLISNLSGVIDGLATHSNQFETLLAQTRALVAGLYAQGQQLQNSTERVATATTSLIGLVDQVTPTIARTQDAVTEALNLLLAAGPKLDQLAVEGPAALTDLARVTQEGTYVSMYLCMMDVRIWNVLLPPGVWTTISNTVFGTAHSETCR